MDPRTDPAYQFFFSSRSILMVVGMDNTIKLVNPCYEEATGWTEDEVLGRPFTDYAHPDDIANVWAFLQKLSGTERQLRVECRLRCKDNSYKWYSWNTNKKNDLFYAIGEDITAQKTLESVTLQHNQTTLDYQKMVEYDFDHIVITDSEGIILFANGAVEAITGFSKTEIVGTKAGKLWGNMMEKGFYEKLWSTIKLEKKPFSGIITNKRKNGDMYQAQVKIIPVLVEDGQIQYFVGIERDISKETELQKLTEMTISREIRMSELKDELEKVRQEKN